ncbi:MAG: prenyltransferase, partial [Actinomycetota bacterium]
MTSVPHLTIPNVEGVLSAEEVYQTALTIAALQLDNGMIPWFDDGHCDPWNHVETAIALDIAGLHRHAERAYTWLADSQHP